MLATRELTSGESRPCAALTKAMRPFDTPYNILPVSPLKVQGSSTGLDFGSDNWLWTGNTKLYLDNTNQYLQATSSTVVRLNAVSEIDLGISAIVEAQLLADELRFIQAVSYVGFDWSNSGNLHIVTSGINRVTFATSTIEPVTDNDIVIGRSDKEFSAGWFTGQVKAGTFKSDVATGTAPIIAASTTKVANLNADLLDGKHVGNSGDVVPVLGANNIWTGVQTIGTNVKLLFRNSNTYIHSVVDTVLSLSASTSLLLAIGGSTKLAVSSGGINVSGECKGITLNAAVADGTIPIVIESTTKCTNLNADIFDGHHVAGIVHLDGVSDTPSSLTAGSDPAFAIVLSGTAGCSAVYYEARGYLGIATSADAMWTIAVQDPDGVVLKTVIVASDRGGDIAPWSVCGYDTGPNAGATGYHLDIDENAGSSTLEVLGAKLFRVLS